VRQAPGAWKSAGLTRRRRARSERLATLERTIASRESLKTVSLGTSKINYMDPRCVRRLSCS